MHLMVCNVRRMDIANATISELLVLELLNQFV